MNAMDIVYDRRRKVHSPSGGEERRQQFHEFFYDRKARHPGRNRPGQWVVRRGEEALRVFPPGTKREVELYVLSLDAPEVYLEVRRVIDQHAESPQGEVIARRAVRAGFILRDGLASRPARD